MSAQGPITNPHKWTERFNYLALDHVRPLSLDPSSHHVPVLPFAETDNDQPIGVGFSYGAMVNNSADAAKEVYDFLQKFYV
jgi:hypothetical protein